MEAKNTDSLMLGKDNWQPTNTAIDMGKDKPGMWHRWWGVGDTKITDKELVCLTQRHPLCPQEFRQGNVKGVVKRMAGDTVLVNLFNLDHRHE